MTRPTSLTVAAAALIALTTFTAKAQTEAADTVIVINNPGAVSVVEHGPDTTINVAGTGDDEGYVYTYTTSTGAAAKNADDMPAILFPFKSHESRDSIGRPSFHSTFFHSLYFGGIAPLQGPDCIKTSLECGIANVIGMRWEIGSLSRYIDVGLGFGYKSLVVSDGMRFDKPGESLIIIKQHPGVEARRSHLYVCHLTIPVTYTAPICRSLGFTAGAVINLNTYTRATSSYKVDNNTYKETYRNLHQRFFTVDIMGSLHLDSDIGIYVKYSPMGLFKSHRGPDTSTLSFGLIMGL